MLRIPNLASKNWKNEYLWSDEGRIQKMNSKFSVFFGFLDAKIRTHRENFRDRGKVIEWESLQVWTSYVSLRVRKNQKTFHCSEVTSCGLQLTRAVHVGSEFESRMCHPFFLFCFFSFSSFFRHSVAFLGRLQRVYQAKSAPCLLQKFDTVEFPWEAVNRFFRVWIF